VNHCIHQWDGKTFDDGWGEIVLCTECGITQYSGKPSRHPSIDSIFQATDELYAYRRAQRRSFRQRRRRGMEVLRRSVPKLRLPLSSRRTPP